MRWSCAMLFAFVLTGCHVPKVVLTTPTTSAPSVQAIPELPVITPTSLESAVATWPSVDPRTAQPSPLSTSGGALFRGLSDEDCRRLARENSSMAKMLEQENTKPRVQLVSKKAPCPETTNDELLVELRALAATATRNRSATDALERFYQLADAEGRTELLSKGILAFDEYRTLAKKFRETGLPALEEEELTRQRAKLLSDLERAEAGIRLLNVDLQTRLGLSVRGDERLWPTGDFGISAEPIDTESQVANALANRADLQFLRKLYHGLSVDTLPTVSEQLRNVNSLTGLDGGMPSLWFPGSRLMQNRTQELKAQLRAATAAEVKIRKEQLFTLTAEREKIVAAEVRVAIVQMESAARRIGLAKSTVENWQSKVEKAKREDKPFDRFPAELEWYKARAELLSEVIAWHGWRAKLRGAIGELGRE